MNEEGGVFTTKIIMFFLCYVVYRKIFHEILDFIAHIATNSETTFQHKGIRDNDR